jgi:hypothetical protein
MRTHQPLLRSKEGFGACSRKHIEQPRWLTPAKSCVEEFRQRAFLQPAYPHRGRCTPSASMDRCVHNRRRRQNQRQPAAKPPRQRMPRKRSAPSRTVPSARPLQEIQKCDTTAWCSPMSRPVAQQIRQTEARRCNPGDPGSLPFHRRRTERRDPPLQTWFPSHLSLQTLFDDLRR